MSSWLISRDTCYKFVRRMCGVVGARGGILCCQCLGLPKLGLFRYKGRRLEGQDNSLMHGWLRCSNRSLFNPWDSRFSAPNEASSNDRWEERRYALATTAGDCWIVEVIKLRNGEKDAALCGSKGSKVSKVSGIALTLGRLVGTPQSRIRAGS